MDGCTILDKTPQISPPKVDMIHRKVIKLRCLALTFKETATYILIHYKRNNNPKVPHDHIMKVQSLAGLHRILELRAKLAAGHTAHTEHAKLQKLCAFLWMSERFP